MRLPSLKNNAKTGSEGPENVPIVFDDGAAYERYMGRWSQLAGDAFLQWLSPAPRLDWLDVGCGNGAFTELLSERCAPGALIGVDPSAEQLDYARARTSLRGAEFRLGNAMALPLSDDSVDAAVMPLVIFFVPEPDVGVSEMTRVVRAGGTVCAYAWDMPGGGFPYHLLQREMRALGALVPKPPSPDASRLEVLQELWTAAGLLDVETTAITVERSFASVEEYWTTIMGGASVGSALATMPPESVALLRARLLSQLPVDEAGVMTCHARANAVKGRVP